MENKLFQLLNRELANRAISAIIFVPVLLIPIFISNYLVVLVFLVICSIILNELDLIKAKTVKKFYTNAYSIVSIFSFFSFILLLITDLEMKLFLIEILITIWLFDTFSYLGGKIIGGKKLFPKISHGKTYSGLLIGLTFSVLIIQIFNVYVKQFSLISIIVSLGIIITAFFGDVCVSLLKRSAEVKDTGTIMPGHGGLLDRFDSFIGVMFLFGVCIYFI